MSDTLHDQQRAFAAHLRDPAHNSAPDNIEDRRMAIYRNLFFNSIEGLLASNFPVIRKTLGEEAWRALIRDFYATHHARTPLFTQIGNEFVEWLATRATKPLSPRERGWGEGPAKLRLPKPWLHDLAHYEYAELALAISDAALPPHDATGDLLDNIPIPSPHAWPLAYTWPVHRIAPDYQPDTPPTEPTLLLLHRNPTGDVHFSQLSPLTFHLLHLIEQNTTETGRTLLQTLATQANTPNNANFQHEAETALHDLRTKGVLLGTVPRC